MTTPSASHPDPEFEEVVRKYEREMYRLILAQVQDPETAEHLTQETFLAAYRRFPDRDPDVEIRYWLCWFGLEQCKAHWRANPRAADDDTSE